MNVRIGINPITWSNDDAPELGGDIPIEVCLSETKQAGYAGTELGGKFPRRTAELKPIMQRHGLAVISGWYDGRCDEKDVSAEMDAITPHLQLLKDMGSTHVVYADTSRGRHGAIWDPISRRPVLKAEEWPTYGRKLTQLAERMADFGVRMAFHHHMGTIIETDAEVGLLMKHTGEAVGLLYDTGHSTFSGGDALQLIKDNVKRVVHVHCKDVRWDTFKRVRDSGASFLDGVLAGMFTVPGDGGLDYGQVMHALAGIGYSGWIVIEAEQDPALADPRTYAERGLATVRAEAARAGLR